MYIARGYLNYVHNSSCSYTIFACAFFHVNAFFVEILVIVRPFNQMARADLVCAAPRTFFTECFETLNLLLSWSEDVHALWI